MATVLIIVALMLMLEVTRRLIENRRAPAPIPIRISPNRRMRRR